MSHNITEVNSLKLSMLDQAPISSGKTARDALQSSIKLAQLGEKLGYERFWIAEHHDLFGLACSNPDVMLGVIGSQTEKIRIGAGAVLLPYYKPFRVAETYNLLATLFPGRVDLGLGRAPGGAAEVSLALSDNYLAQVNRYSQSIDELLNFLHDRFPEDDIYGKISPNPVPDSPPQTWLLGTSEKSALLAAEKGMNYAFGHFMTEADGPKVVETYRRHFQKTDSEPYVIIAVHVICADTNEKAKRIALSTLVWSLLQEKQMDGSLVVPSVDEAKHYVFTEKEKLRIDKMRKTMIIGDPETVKKKMEHLQEQYQADEWMIVTITHREADKFHSYKLLSEMWNKE